MLICVGILVCIFAGLHGWVLFRGMKWMQKNYFLPISGKLVYVMIALEMLLRAFCTVILATWPLYMNLTPIARLFPVLQEPYSIFHAYFQNYALLWMFSMMISFGHFAGTLYFWRQKV